MLYIVERHPVTIGTGEDTQPPSLGSVVVRNALRIYSAGYFEDKPMAPMRRVIADCTGVPESSSAYNAFRQGTHSSDEVVAMLDAFYASHVSIEERQPTVRDCLVSGRALPQLDFELAMSGAEVYVPAPVVTG